MHRVHGTAKIFAAARFYFHKDQCFLISADQVDLSGATPFGLKISIQDFVSVTSQKTGGQSFAARAAGVDVLR